MATPASSLNENVKLKVVVYFLIGLITSVAGLIVAALWLKFKAKTNRTPKFTALILGVVVSFLFSYVISPMVIQPQVEKALYSKYPELKVVKEEVTKSYPDAKVSVSSQFGVSPNSDRSPNSSTLTVDMQVEKHYDGKTRQKIGQQICNTLNSINKKYDNVRVKSTQYSGWFVPYINVPIGWSQFNNFAVVGTCDEWFNDPKIPTLSP